MSTPPPPEDASRTRSLGGTRKARIAAVVVAVGFGLLLVLLRWGGVIGESGPATPRPIATPAPDLLPSTPAGVDAEPADP